MPLRAKESAQDGRKGDGCWGFPDRGIMEEIYAASWDRALEEP